MKKLYTIILATAFALATINANATKQYIVIGATGNSFTPSSISVMVGDTMVWTLAGGIHNVTSGAIPSGATPFVSGTISTLGALYMYPVTTGGSYTYYCSFHGTATSGMMGTFFASSSGITDPTVSSLTSAFPNPCVDKLIFKYNGIDKIIVYNVVGEQVKTTELAAGTGTLEMNLEGMPSGIYFYRTYKDGLVYETRKIVKAK